MAQIKNAYFCCRFSACSQWKIRLILRCAVLNSLKTLCFTLGQWITSHRWCKLSLARIESSHLVTFWKNWPQDLMQKCNFKQRWFLVNIAVHVSWETKFIHDFSFEPKPWSFPKLNQVVVFYLKLTKLRLKTKNVN